MPDLRDKLFTGTPDFYYILFADDVAELCELLKCQCFATDGDRNAKFLNAFLDHFFGKMNVRRIIQAIGKRLSALIEGCTDDLKH